MPSLNKYYSQKITTAEPLGGFLLQVAFEDGFSAKIDLAHLPDAAASFTPLHDPVLFAKAAANPKTGTVEWPGGITLSPIDLRAWCEAGHILNGEETKQWIEKAGRGGPAAA